MLIRVLIIFFPLLAFGGSEANMPAQLEFSECSITLPVHYQKIYFDEKDNRLGYVEYLDREPSAIIDFLPVYKNIDERIRLGFDYIESFDSLYLYKSIKLDDAYLIHDEKMVMTIVDVSKSVVMDFFYSCK